MTGTAAVVGTGLIGRAWAIAFARAGWSVRLWDADPQAPGRARAAMADMLADLASNELLDGQSPDAVEGRITAHATLAEALQGADWVQENAPEDVRIKQAPPRPARSWRSRAVTAWHFETVCLSVAGQPRLERATPRPVMAARASAMRDWASFSSSVSPAMNTRPDAPII